MLGSTAFLLETDFVNRFAANGHFVNVVDFAGTDLLTNRAANRGGNFVNA